MNIDRGKESFTPEEIADLRSRLLAWKEDEGLSWTKVGGRVGVPQGTLSVWSGGAYQGDNAAIAAKVNRFFLHREAQEEVERDAPIVPSFQPTKTAQRITGVLRWAARGKFVVVVGDPGTGKTAACDQFAAAVPNVWKVTISPVCGRLNAMLLTINRALGGPQLGGSGHLLSGNIRDVMRRRPGVLIIDEAQHLEQPSLEELRAIHDETRVGLALVGNREVLTRLEGNARSAAFAQLYSRASLRLILPRPEEQDIGLLLDAWSVEHPKQREFLRGLALKPGSGGLRSLTHTLEYATIAAQATDEPRELDHLKDAWSALSTRVATV